jgi:uncharacterized protein
LPLEDIVVTSGAKSSLALAPGQFLDHFGEQTEREFTMPITAIVAAVLLPLYIILQFRVIGVRRSAKISIGDGDNGMLIHRMRVHANFAENVPYALVLMGLAEGLHASSATLWAAGVCLILGRLVHAIGMGREPNIFPLRVAGVLLTVASMVIAAVASLIAAVAQLHII